MAEIHVGHRCSIQGEETMTANFYTSGFSKQGNAFAWALFILFFWLGETMLHANASVA